MLLALDDNNHQHGGATHAQISNLPQSTVQVIIIVTHWGCFCLFISIFTNNSWCKMQVENLQECAVCLEKPTIGETIRHLPCLHGFHKDVYTLTLL